MSAGAGGGTEMNSRVKIRKQKHAVLNVKNFGPIAHGSVELRPLTVFTGPSNTGKSWLATLIYAVMNHSQEQSMELRYGIYNGFLETSGDLGSIKFPEKPTEWLHSLEEDKPIILTEIDKKYVKSIYENLEGSIMAEILRCFGLSVPRHLVREGAIDSRADIGFSPRKHPFVENYRLTINGEKKNEYLVNMKNNVEITPSKNRKYINNEMINMLNIINEIKYKKDNDTDNELILRFSFITLQFIFESISDFSSEVWYLPADRGGIMHAHHAVVSALIQSASHAGLNPQSSIPTLSGILSDFLRKLISLAEKQKLDQKPKELYGSEFAENIERRVLDGRVAVEGGDINYPRFSWRPRRWDRALPLLNVSSMVSELAPLVLYLRHIVSQGDTLILEEPEAHLHPSMQVALVQQVAQWVRGGIRVILTTHSEWVLEELSNLVASKASDNGLDQDCVGLWQFVAKENDAGSKIKEIKWNEDEGGFETGYEEIAAEIHNRWSHLVSVDEDR